MRSHIVTELPTHHTNAVSDGGGDHSACRRLDGDLFKIALKPSTNAIQADTYVQNLLLSRCFRLKSF